jgi:hypothetical protein
MAIIGGSGTARKIKNPCSIPFGRQLILPPLTIGFVLRLRAILPAHENRRLRLLPCFRDFLALVFRIFPASDRIIAVSGCCGFGEPLQTSVFGGSLAFLVIDQQGGLCVG